MPEPDITGSHNSSVVRLKKKMAAFFESGPLPCTGEHCTAEHCLASPCRVI